MSEIAVYCVIMFWAGVLLTKAVFFFQQKLKTKHFYLVMSASLLQILDSVHSVHVAAAEYAVTELKKTETLEENELEQYLKEEMNKVSIFMELYTLVFLKAVPDSGRKYFNYRTWSEASLLIEKLRGLAGEKNEG